MHGLGGQLMIHMKKDSIKLWLVVQERSIGNVMSIVIKIVPIALLVRHIKAHVRVVRMEQLHVLGNIIAVLAGHV